MLWKKNCCYKFFLAQKDMLVLGNLTGEWTGALTDSAWFCSVPGRCAGRAGGGQRAVSRGRAREASPRDFGVDSTEREWRGSEERGADCTRASTAMEVLTCGFSLHVLNSPVSGCRREDRKEGGRKCSRWSDCVVCLHNSRCGYIC